MRTTLARLATINLVVLIVVGCSPAATTSPSPSVSAAPTSGLVATSAPAGSATPVVSAGPSTAAIPQPSYMIETATFPIRGGARERGMQIEMAAGPDASVFITIPTVGGSTLAILDRAGKPRQGWPIAVIGAQPCGPLHAVPDGSVRVVCTLGEPGGDTLSPTGVFAFDANGRLRPGWPIALDGSTWVARMIGDDLTMFASWPLPDNNDGQPTEEFAIVTIGSAGAVRTGTRVPMECCDGVPAIGPDGVVAVVRSISGERSDVSSEITVLDRSGVQPGWPLKVDGIASPPAFLSDGRFILTAGSPAHGTTNLMAVPYDREGIAAGNVSKPVPIVTVNETWHDTGGCSANPRQPLVARDDAVVLFSEADDAVMGLVPGFGTFPDWPYRPASGLVMRDERYVKEDAYCPSLAIPAIGYDGSVYLSLQARTSTVGGSLVALNPDGRKRPGFRVELTRPDSEFWSVVEGPDGTVFALAIEPESSRTSSASVLGFAHDSTDRYVTTIIEP